MTVSPLGNELRAALTRVAPATSAKAARIAPSPAVDVATPRPVMSATAREVRELSVAPPVDTVKIAALRSRIETGSYVIEPAKIADRMIALDLPRR